MYEHFCTVVFFLTNVIYGLTIDKFSTSDNVLLCLTCHSLYTAVVLQHGFSSSFVDCLEANNEDLIREFFQNLAALPRRCPRGNRRGRMLAGQRLMEKRNTKQQENELLKNAANWKSDSCTAKSNVNNRGIAGPASATPELDKLEARSKAAKHKLKSTGTETKTSMNASETSKRMAISRPNAFSTSTPVMSTHTTSTTPTKKDCSSIKPSGPSSAKTTVKIKLKRPPFSSPSLETCKISKISWRFGVIYHPVVFNSMLQCPAVLRKICHSKRFLYFNVTSRVR